MRVRRIRPRNIYIMAKYLPLCGLRDDCATLREARVREIYCIYSIWYIYAGPIRWARVFHVRGAASSAGCLWCWNTNWPRAIAPIVRAWFGSIAGTIAPSGLSRDDNATRNLVAGIIRCILTMWKWINVYKWKIAIAFNCIQTILCQIIRLPSIVHNFNVFPLYVCLGICLPMANLQIQEKIYT